MTGTVESRLTSESLRRVFIFSGGILVLFAINLFVLEPVFSKWIGPRAAQIVYIIIRIAGLVGLAYGLARDAKRNRFQTVTTVLLVGFIDQVILKGIWIRSDIAANPAAWVGVEPGNAAIFVNMAMGYLFFIPIILILAFVGMEATRFRREWKA